MTAYAATLRRLAAARIDILALAASPILAALPLLRSTGWPQIVAAAGVAILCAVAAASRVKGRVDHGAPADAPAEPGPNELSLLLADLLPVWRAHLTTVRSQTENAVNEVIDRFASMSGRFEAAGFEGATGRAAQVEQSPADLLAECERQLQPVVSVMAQILDSNSALMTSVQQLSAATADLRENANAVGQVAFRTNILAINAAVEAAHAGSSGRGFAVIAKEIRSLSDLSANSAKLIDQRVLHVGKIVQATYEAAEQTATRDRSALELSRQVVEDVLTNVRELGANAEVMRREGSAIRQQIEAIVTSLQFQDRVTQILGVVDQDLGRLTQAIGSNAPLPDAGTWLEAIQAQYTTHEQRSSHGALATVAEGQPESTGGVQFF